MLKILAMTMMLSQTGGTVHKKIATISGGWHKTDIEIYKVVDVPENVACYLALKRTYSPTISCVKVER